MEQRNDRNSLVYMFEEMDTRKIGIMNRGLQQKIGSTDFAHIVEIGTNPILIGRSVHL